MRRQTTPRKILATALGIACSLAWANAWAFDCESASFRRAQGHVQGISARLAQIGPACAKIEAKAYMADSDPMLALDYLACYAKTPTTRMPPEIQAASLGISRELADSEAFGAGFSAGYGSSMLTAPQVASRAAQLIFRSERALLSVPGMKDDLAALRDGAASLSAALAPDREGPAFMNESGTSRSTRCSADFSALAAPWGPQRRDALISIHKALNPQAWAAALDAKDDKLAIAQSALALDWVDKGADASLIKARSPEAATNPKASLFEALAAKIGLAPLNKK